MSTEQIAAMLERKRMTRDGRCPDCGTALMQPAPLSAEERIKSLRTPALEVVEHDPDEIEAQERLDRIDALHRRAAQQRARFEGERAARRIPFENDPAWRALTAETDALEAERLDAAVLVGRLREARAGRRRMQAARDSAERDRLRLEGERERRDARLTPKDDGIRARLGRLVGS